jgi:hypothetical protein
MLGLLAYAQTRAGGLAGLLGAYSVTAEQRDRYQVKPIISWFLLHISELDLWLGVVPFVATLILVGVALMRTADRNVRAFACAVVPVILLMAALVSAFVVFANVARIEERNLFYVGFLALIVFMLPAAWIAGRVDRLSPPAPATGDISAASPRVALMAALRRPSFLVMTAAYFVCGMQLLFITTHLPSYLAICGMDPSLSAGALGAIALFNVFGSLFFGWAGGHWSKLGLLGGIYIARSIVLAGYFVMPPTPASTLVFASAMGFLWLGVGPLVAGSVVEMFGLRWQAMIQGVAFMSHQVGSFAGALGGGLLFDALGSYDLAWRLGVAMGLTAGIVQVAFASMRPPPATTPIAA